MPPTLDAEAPPGEPDPHSERFGAGWVRFPFVDSGSSDIW